MSDVSVALLPVFIRPWAMVLALKNLGFTDAELTVGAVRTLPGVTEAGVATNVDPRKAYYAVAVVVSRHGNSFTIKVVDEWPASPDQLSAWWPTFCADVKSGVVSQQALAKAMANVKFDAQQLENDCRERGLMT